MIIIHFVLFVFFHKLFFWLVCFYKVYIFTTEYFFYQPDEILLVTGKLNSKLELFVFAINVGVLLLFFLFKSSIKVNMYYCSCSENGRAITISVLISSINPTSGFGTGGIYPRTKIRISK